MTRPVPIRPATAVARKSATVSRKGAATRETIMRASTALFAERGFAAASMREVAERAGVPLSGFYYYFASKHDVLAAIMDTVLGELDSACGEALAQTEGPVDQLGAMVAAHVRVHLRDPEAARVADAELRSLDDDTRPSVMARRDEYEGRFRAVLEEGVRRGDFATDISIAVAAMSILMMSTGVLAWWRPDGALSIDDTARMLGRYAVAIASAGV